MAGEQSNIRMSDEPPAELFGSDSLPETDDVIKGDETMQFSTSEESSKMVNADLQKVMDSISVSADGVDVDDEKLLSQFVVGNLGADDHHHGPTTAEESSSSSLADEKALLESVLARAANSDQVATLGDQVATLGGQVATLGGQGRTLGSLVGALSGHVASPAAGDETPEETMQVERLMESIHSGSSNDEPKTLQDDDDTISSTTIAVPTTTTYQSLTSLQAAADIFGDDEDDDDDVIKAAGMQSSTADDNGSQQTVMTALVGGGGVITASGGGYVMTSSSSGGGQLMTSSVVREEEELTSVEDVLSALHSELDEEEEVTRGGGGGGGGEEIKKVEEKSKWKLKVEQQRQQQAQVTKPAKPSSDGASGPMYKCFVSGCKSTTSSAAGSGATSGGKSVTTSAGAGSGATSGGKSVTTSAGAGSGATSGGEMRFFKPPPNPLIFKRWARNLCQGSQQLAYTALICELHFRPQDIREVFVNGKKNWVLTEGALPKPSTASALAAAAAQAGNAAAAAMNSRPPGGKRPVGRPSGLYRQQQFEALQAAQARANKLQREKLSQEIMTMFVDGDDIEAQLGSRYEPSHPTPSGFPAVTVEEIHEGRSVRNRFSSINKKKMLENTEDSSPTPNKLLSGETYVSSDGIAKDGIPVHDDQTTFDRSAGLDEYTEILLDAPIGGDDDDPNNEGSQGDNEPLLHQEFVASSSIVPIDDDNRRMRNFFLDGIAATILFGFRRGRGIDNAVFGLNKEALSALDGSQKVLGIFCDLSKAYDCVDHDLLLSKLWHYGSTLETRRAAPRSRGRRGIIPLPELLGEYGAEFILCGCAARRGEVRRASSVR
ncbi:uncharacterized protein LOC120354700 [Nilaparvata lugens]|uniref:uncharacterized protein LOC120354700 n=1 Tax=Nilaparvata lugens TaxID=108931 RepID=UPI00193D5A18|nr:uncharacterized protein LOC120354700 [Nilaparvata lugens]